MLLNTNKTSISISREDIYLSDLEICKRYLGISKIPCSIQSPLRDDDECPSFSFFERDGTLFWKDFGTGESGTIITLLARLWHSKYKEVLLKIKADCSTNCVPSNKLVKRYKGKIHLLNTSSVDVITRKWKQWDIDYWSSYGICKDFAVWCNVYPISDIIFIKEHDGKQEKIIIPAEKYAYAYFEWKDDKQSIKIYQPYSQTIKWLSKHDSSVWDLWKQAFLYAKMKSNDCLIITSSRKDAMCLWNNLGIPSIAMQGEGYKPKPQVMEQILSTYKHVYIWYDNDFRHKNDNPGQDNARSIISLYPSIKNICIPSTYHCKDPSDLFKKYNVFELLEVWNKQK